MTQDDAINHRKQVNLPHEVEQNILCCMALLRHCGIWHFFWTLTEGRNGPSIELLRQGYREIAIPVTGHQGQNIFGWTRCSSNAFQLNTKLQKVTEIIMASLLGLYFLILMFFHGSATRKLFPLGKELVGGEGGGGVYYSIVVIDPSYTDWSEMWYIFFCFWLCF